MSKEYFIDNISDENLAKITDKMLRFEKNKRSSKVHLFKIIPAVAAIVLVIGAVNMLPGIITNTNDLNVGGNGPDNMNAAASSGEKSADINLYIPTATSVNNTDTETVATQIDDLLITTPKGQEPIQNDNGTITLPGGGTYINPTNGETVIAPKDTIVGKDGSAYNPNNLITIEKNGQHMLDVNLYNYNLNIQDNLYWKSHIEVNNIVYELNDGTKIIMAIGGSINSTNQDNYGYMEFLEKTMIEYTSGLKVDAPANTIIEFKNGSYVTTLGDGDATITYPNGTSSVMHNTSSGTILDGEGNIAEQSVNIPTDIKSDSDKQEGNTEPIIENPWQMTINLNSHNGIEVIYELYNDGTKIITDDYAKIGSDGDSKVYLTANKSVCAIELTNGVVINAPINTMVDLEDNILTVITIGDGGATITQPDGTTSTVPAGTVLDNEGNIVK